MSERSISDEELKEEERSERARTDLRHETIDIGTGLGGGLAPVLPTDIDGHHPDSQGPSSLEQDVHHDAPPPNWAAGEEVDAGLERMETERAPLNLPKDTHIVTVFGEDIGEIVEIYGYAPSTEAQWASVRDGDRKILVPVMSAQLEEDRLQVPYPKDLIESSPDVPDHDLSLAEEMAIYAHYNERRMLPATTGESSENERTLQVISA